MQCKDISDVAVLRFLSGLPMEKSVFNGFQYKMAGTWFRSDAANSIWHVLPAETPEKVALKKMEALIRRGLVEGCSCGCRGDFLLTSAGEAFLANYKE